VREPLLPGIRDKLYKDAAVNEADRWKLQQFALSNAKKVR
jgi:hypothetical protein